jgi:DNA polymerase III subunit chi
MTQHDFYILKDDAYLAFACRLLEKVYKQGYRIFVQTKDEADANMLDKLLWTYKDISFVPHQLVGAEHLAAPIVIGQATPDAFSPDITLVLANVEAPVASKSERVLYVVPNQPAWKQASRQLYQALQSSGTNAEVHHI